MLNNRKNKDLSWGEDKRVTGAGGDGRDGGGG